MEKDSGWRRIQYKEKLEWRKIQDGERFRTEKDSGQRSIQDGKGFRMENGKGFRAEKDQSGRRKGFRLTHLYAIPLAPDPIRVQIYMCFLFNLNQ